MKRLLTPKHTIVAGGIAAMLMAASAPIFAQHCSNATLWGNYGFLLTGVAVEGSGTPGPRAGGGLATFDGRGAVQGTETRSKAGTISRNVGFVGTYKVNSNCTGTIEITRGDGDTRQGDIVIVGNGDEIFGVQTDDFRAVTFHAKEIIQRRR